LEITALVENRSSVRSERLRTELGLAVHVGLSGAGGDLLFDAGASDAFVHNAFRLGIDLSRVRAVVVSHGHYDHVGGLPAFFSLNACAPVYLHQRAASRCVLRILPFLRRGIGVAPSLLKASPDRFRLIDRTLEIADGVSVVAGLSRYHPLPPDSRFFFIEDRGLLVPDDFRHEILLVVQRPGGLVVLAGGCHRGVRNAVATIRDQFPGREIQALFCGFQAVRLPLTGMMPGGRIDLGQLARDLLAMDDVRTFYTCHSTSPGVVREMQKVMGERLVYFGAGCRVVL